MISHKIVKRALFSLSLANLCFIRAWNVLLRQDDPGVAYFSAYTPIASDYIAVIINVLILAIFVFGLLCLGDMTISKRYHRIVKAGTYVIIFLPVIVVLDGLRKLMFSGLFNVEVLNLSSGWHYLILFVAGFVALLALFFRKIVIRAIVVAFIVVSPFVIITFAHSAYVAIKSEQKISAVNVGGIHKNLDIKDAVKNHVVWLIFDETDQRLAFEDRPEGLELTEMDRLKSESLFFTKAYPPAGCTSLSIPSYLVGETVSTVIPLSSSNSLLITDISPKGISFSERNIFRELSEANIRTHVVGWYHPYCRLYNADADNCFWLPEPGYQIAKQEDGLIDRCAKFAYFVLPGKFYSGSFVDIYKGINEEALRMLSGDGLVFIHHSIPHMPSIYDRLRDDFSTRSIEPDTYFDNMALVDKTLGQFRSELESEGLWDNSTIIFTSDHWWRQSDQYDGKIDERVPLMIKLPNQKKGKIISTRVETVFLKKFVFDALKNNTLGAVIDFATN